MSLSDAEQFDAADINLVATQFCYSLATLDSYLYTR